MGQGWHAVFLQYPLTAEILRWTERLVKTLHNSNHPRISSERLHSFCVKALTACGMSEKDGRITADVLVTADTWGVFTHGTRSLPDYVHKVKAGGIDPRAVPQVVDEGLGWAILDGHAAMGMVTSYRAMETAIQIAKIAGIAYVGVKDGTHFGPAGYYASMALAEDMVGLAISNADPNMTVSGGKGRILGNNPLAFAAPAGKERPILLDIAMSTVAAAKIFTAQKQGKPIPDTWLADGDGLPTTDKSAWPQPGGLLPIGGHKGYGLALMVEVLAAVCTGAGILKEVPSWHMEMSTRTNTGHAFVVVNVGAMLPIEHFKARMDGMIRAIKGSPKAKGSERIYLPGEMEWETREAALKNGIELPSEVVESLIGLGREMGLDIDCYFVPATG